MTRIVVLTTRHGCGTYFLINILKLFSETASLNQTRCGKLLLYFDNIKFLLPSQLRTRFDETLARISHPKKLDGGFED